MSDPNAESAPASRARRGRNLLIAGALIVFVLVIFVVTMIKLAANVPHPL